MRIIRNLFWNIDYRLSPPPLLVSLISEFIKDISNNRCSFALVIKRESIDIRAFAENRFVCRSRGMEFERGRKKCVKARIRQPDGGGWKSFIIGGERGEDRRGAGSMNRDVFPMPGSSVERLDTSI